MVDLDRDGGVIWDYELHNGLVLDQEKSVTFFLSFEGIVGGDVHCLLNSYLFVADRNIRNVRLVSSLRMIQKQRPSTITLKPTKMRSFVSYLSLWPISDLIITVPAKPKRSSWMKSISKGGGNIDKSMISRPKEDGFVHVAHMEYAADSGFTSTGVDPSWNTLLEGLHGYLGKAVVANEMDFIKDFIRNYSERQHNQPVAVDTPRPPPPVPSRTRSQNGAPTPSSSLHATRTRLPPEASHRPISPVIEDDRPPPPPPRRRTPPTHTLPPPPEQPLPPQPGGFLLPRGMETNPTSAKIHHSRSRYSLVFNSMFLPFYFWLMVKFYRESPPSPVVLSHSISHNKSISPTVVPSRSVSSTVSTGTLIRREESHRSQPGDLPSSSPTREISTSTLIRRQESHRSQPGGLISSSPTHEVLDNNDDDAESVANQTQTVQPSSQRLQHGTASWILASRTLHAPKKPVDSHFMTYMADIRRQTNESDASSTGSTPPVSLILAPRVSVTSSAFSQSLSISSSPPPPVVEFPPTPVFKDEIPERIIRNLKVSTSCG